MMEQDNLRYPTLHLGNRFGAIPGARYWNTDFGLRRNQKWDQRRAGGGISRARHDGTLPAMEYRFDVVAVGVEYKCSKIARMVFGVKSGRSVISPSG